MSNCTDSQHNCEQFKKLTVRELIDSAMETYHSIHNISKATKLFFDDLAIVIKSLTGNNDVHREFGNSIVHQLSQLRHSDENDPVEEFKFPEEPRNNEAIGALSKLIELDNMIKQLHIQKESIYGYMLKEVTASTEPEAEIAAFNSLAIAKASANHDLFFPKVEPGVSVLHEFPLDSVNMQIVYDPSFAVPIIGSQLNVEAKNVIVLNCQGIVTAIKIVRHHIVCGFMNGKISIFNFPEINPLIEVTIHSRALTALCFWNCSIISASLDGNIALLDMDNFKLKKRTSIGSPIQCMVLVRNIIFLGAADGYVHKVYPLSLTSMKLPAQINRGFTDIQEVNFNGLLCLAILCCDGFVMIRSLDFDLIESIELPSRGIAMASMPSSDSVFLIVRILDSSFKNHCCLIRQMAIGSYEVNVVDFAESFGCISWNQNSYVLKPNGLLWVQSKHSGLWQKVSNLNQKNMSASSATENYMAFITTDGSVVCFRIQRSDYVRE